MLNIAGGILFSRVGCGGDSGDGDDDGEEGRDRVFDVRRAASLRTLPRSRGTSPAGLRGRGGSPGYHVGSLRAYNRAVAPRELFTSNCQLYTNFRSILRPGLEQI